MASSELMRTSLYAGGTSPVKMIQAGFYNEDCIVYDLEDSVSAGEKDAARFLVYNLVKYQRPKNKYVVVRVNGLYSEYLDEDLEAIVRAQPDAIRLPKVEYAKEVERIDQRVTQIEQAAGLPVGGIKLWCNIESYLGVMNAQEIAKASPRVAAMAIGAEDLTASLGAQRTKPGWEIFYARNAILMACRAAGISAQDAVFSDINDKEGLQRDLEMTRTLGFDGKTCVHPRQIDAVNACFTPSAVVNIKEPSIVDFVKDGTINRIEASGIRGQLGDAILSGEVELAEPVILRTHGGRPRAIEAGELQIDVAFIGASAADDYGNCTSQIGPNACGSMGYSFVDAHNAGCVVVVTDNLVDYPCCPVSISQQYVDYVVKVDSIGDPAKIGAGAARLTKNPRDLMIAQRTVDVMSASRRFKDGFSFQTGAGAISIATTKYLAERMKERGVKASFALGGIPAAIIDMYDEGLVRVVACSQSFDAVAAQAISSRPGVIEIDNADYANAYSKGGYLNREDFGILGALEVDTDFNVNILTGSSGEMRGGLGGGPDVAGGAQVSIVTIPVIRGRTPSIVKKVFTTCTPGETVAVVVTEAGIALNPKHKNYQELKEDLEAAGLKLVTIEELQQLAESMTGVPKPIETGDKVVCMVEYRDGSVVDVIRQIKK